MSAITVPRTAAGRPATVTAAAALLALLGAVGLLAAPVGAAEGGGAVFIAIALVISGLRFVATFGVWRFRRRAAILGFVVSLLDTLLAAPGLLFSPNGLWRLLTAVGVVFGIATLVLLVLPASRRAYA